MTNNQNNIRIAAKFLEERGLSEPEFGLILGSGLGELAEEITDAIAIPYEEIPYFPISTVEGHKGQLVYGNLSGKKVVAMQGRFHFYEGYGLEAGCSADFVLLEAADPVEALRLRATRLQVRKRGRLLATSPARQARLHLPGRNVPGCARSTAQPRSLMEGPPGADREPAAHRT